MRAVVVVKFCLLALIVDFFRSESSSSIRQPHIEPHSTFPAPPPRFFHRPTHPQHIKPNKSLSQQSSSHCSEAYSNISVRIPTRHQSSSSPPQIFTTTYGRKSYPPPGYKSPLGIFSRGIVPDCPNHGPGGSLQGRDGN